MFFFFNSDEVAALVSDGYCHATLQLNGYGLMRLC